MGATAKILVVDDEPDTVALIELTLRTAGFQVQTAISGEQTLRKVRDESYDLIVLDIMMPDVSGYDVMRRLSLEVNTPPPVVFLTAKSRPEDREMGEALGAAGFLVKPVTRGDLLDTVYKALGWPVGRRASP